MRKDPVGINELARHLATNRETIHRLREKGVIEVLEDDKYDLDDCREKYIRYLRARPPRGTGNAELLKARTQLAQLRVDERSHELIRRDEWFATWQIAWNFVLVRLTELPSRIFPRDVPNRRVVEAAVNQLRQQVCDEIERQADALEQTGEPAPGGVGS
jgi:hypothetical protein